MVGAYEEKAEKRRSLPDFSRRAIGRHVATATAQKPYVLYPLALGLLGGLSALLLGTSLLPALVGGGIGIGAWLLDNTLRRDHHAARHIRELHALLASRAQASLASLREELEEVGERDGLDQLQRLTHKYETFEALLRRKLNPAELTFGRYLGMAEQLYLGALDNLNTVTNIRRGLNAIDASRIEARAERLAADGRIDESERQEMEALSRRRALLERQRAQVVTLLSQNESAMTKLDEVAASIATLNLGDRRASMDMEQAMLELEELARRSADYEVKT
ncbi:hypothetical protein [Endothiovibrio diazotrophicus]